MKSGKRHRTEGMKLPNQEKNQNARRKGNLQILGNIRSWHHQTSGDERKNLKKNIPENETASRDKTSNQKPYQIEKYLGCLLVRYSGRFLKWTRENLKQMDQRTRKLMTMHKALYPRDKVDRLYVLRKVGGRGLASIEDTMTYRHNDLKTT